MATKTYIGLSLGNHNSVIAILNKDHAAEVIANEEGEHKTPSYIAFAGPEEYHGSQAKHQIVRNAQNTIAGFRDLLGKPFAEGLAREGFAQVAKGESDEPVFVVETEDEDSGEARELRLTAHDATVRYLQRLKTTAEEYLGRAIEGAVLAVPAAFDAAQRQSVSTACADAGLPLLQLVDEPVAAAVQYGLVQGATPEDAKDSVAVVVDVGGTSTDVSVVVASGGLLSVVGRRHSTEVSGERMDDVLAKHFAAEFKRQSGIDVLEGSPRALRKLLQSVEVTKRTLSAAPSAPCAVESLADGQDFSGSISRSRFDILAGKIMAPLDAAVLGALEDAGYSPAQVDQVLLSGGAARVRKLQTRVALLFPETTRVRDDAGELDEVVAAGCAAQAALTAQGSVTAEPADVKAAVLANAVGLRLTADCMEPVLQKNAPLPASRTVKVAMPAGEKRAYIAVSEGEPVPPQDEDEEEDEDEEAEPQELPRYRPSRLLAEMVLELDAADDKTRIEVNFFVDTDASLTVTATEPISGKSITAQVPAA
ncbi:Hsp70 protein that interacts with Zuo1p [Coemansia sp. RSA 552]|nr:Hsp70 protein that interacts with Zuo1p [Coemansia sp. RSA 552]